MSRGKTQKLYRTFVKGLITEAGFLTYPEDASIDELNTVIHKKGNRSRRLGLDYEKNSTPITLPNTNNTSVSTEYFWRAPDNESGLNFLVVQVGRYLYFFDSSVEPLSNGLKSFTVNLNDFKAATATSNQVKQTHVSMASGKGYLFVASQYIEPFTVDYDAATDSIKTIKVIIQMRDFDGVSDGLANDEEPTTLSKEHNYNLQNQGWLSPGTGASATAGDGVTGGTPSPGVNYNPWTGDVRFLDQLP